MKRQRPPMPPLAVRVQVAERQYMRRYPWMTRWIIGGQNNGSSQGSKLKYLLSGIFGDSKFALDHDPALILRKYNPRIKDVAARYTPHAHDPDALVYREKADHQQKTTGRKPGAERTITTKGSDVGLKTKFARLERPSKSGTKLRSQKRKRTIKSRGFAKGPKKRLQSRGFR